MGELSLGPEHGVIRLRIENMAQTTVCPEIAAGFGKKGNFNEGNARGLQARATVAAYTADRPPTFQQQLAEKERTSAADRYGKGSVGGRGTKKFLSSEPEFSLTTDRRTSLPTQGLTAEDDDDTAQLQGKSPKEVSLQKSHHPDHPHHMLRRFDCRVRVLRAYGLQESLDAAN